MNEPDRMRSAGLIFTVVCLVNEIRFFLGFLCRRLNLTIFFLDRYVNNNNNSEPDGKKKMRQVTITVVTLNFSKILPL